MQVKAQRFPYWVCPNLYLVPFLLAIVLNDFKCKPQLTLNISGIQKSKWTCALKSFVNFKSVIQRPFKGVYSSTVIWEVRKCHPHLSSCSEQSPDSLMASWSRSTSGSSRSKLLGPECQTKIGAWNSGPCRSLTRDHPSVGTTEAELSHTLSGWRTACC